MKIIKALSIIIIVVVVVTACAQPSSNDRVSEPAIHVISAPEQLRPIDMAHHVSVLLDEENFKESRIWYFRGLARSAVENDLADNNAFEAFNQKVRQNPKMKHLLEADTKILKQLIVAAIAWEASTPLEFPQPLEESDSARIPEVRKNMADYLLAFVGFEEERRSSVAEIEEQVSLRGVADEAKKIAPAHDILRIEPISSAKIACSERIRFVGQLGSVISANANGNLAAVYACDELMIVEAVSGRILQRTPEQTYVVSAVTVRAKGDNIMVVALERNGSAKSADASIGFFKMTATAPPIGFELPLPDKVLRAEDVSISRSAKSRDGKILALEFCSKPYGCDFWFAAYDIDEQKLVWESGDIDGPNSRLISHIDKDGQSYLLVSEVRSEKSKKVGIEHVDISNNSSQVFEYVQNLDRPLNYHTPSCELTRLAGENGGPRFSYELVDPINGASVVLNHPSRRAIDSCTVSVDGSTLLVSVPPFIHRFSISK